MEDLSNEKIIEVLNQNFAAYIKNVEVNYGILTIVADASKNVDLIKFLVQEQELQFNFLTDLCGIHFPEQELQLGVIYHLHSFKHNKRIRIKFFLPYETPDIQTLTGLFESANWMERETFDFYGINFLGHPNLVRILNVDDMTVFPMRKQYPLEDPYRTDKKDDFFGR